MDTSTSKSGVKVAPMTEAMQLPGMPQIAAHSYVWSWIRIWEQVTTNVLTLIIAAGGGSLVVQVYQNVFHHIVLPADLLTGIIFASLGVLFAMAAIAGLVYLYMRKHPLAAVLALVALALGTCVGEQITKLTEQAWKPSEGDPTTNK
jgi:cation transport ATPase